MTGILFEILTGGQPFSRYPKFLAVLGTLYIVEPLLTRVYIQNACAAGEKASQLLHCLSHAKLFTCLCCGMLLLYMAIVLFCMTTKLSLSLRCTLHAVSIGQPLCQVVHQTQIYCAFAVRSLFYRHLMSYQSCPVMSLTMRARHWHGITICNLSMLNLSMASPCTISAC